MTVEPAAWAFLVLFAVSFGVGIVVGLTGMGGGALMTPALIFLGIPPSAAVANDLVAAAAGKSVGAAVHWRAGAPDLRLAGLLVTGSVPAALAGSAVVGTMPSGAGQETFLKVAIGCTLLLAAATYSVRRLLSLRRGYGESTMTPELRVVPTILVGAVGGLLVGITSVGAGSLIMVVLLLLYPALSAVRLVGTDLVQAVPLVMAAAVGHIVITGVDWAVLLPLLLGSPAGTLIGARLASRVRPRVVRRGIVVVLTITGLSLLQVPPALAAVAGVLLLVAGPAAWKAARRVGAPEEPVGTVPATENAGDPAP